MNEIYVIGHHNPDTDSIVSAMAYAALRNALGDRNYVAAHMDHISDQTQRMLDRFGFQPPRTVQNVRTQVEDLDYDTPPALNATVTMDRAWHIMREQRISAIPVINEDGTLYGTLSAGDIATYSMTTIANPRVEAVPLFNLLSVIEGRLLNDSGDLIDTVSGNVVIALPQSCENLLFNDPDNIVICGNQPDMIRRALDIGVSCLILCQTEVDPDLLDKYNRGSRGVWVAQTPALSVIDWGRYAFDSDAELVKFFEMHGHQLVALEDISLYAAAEEESLDLPEYPQEGYIVDKGDYIIVHF